MFVARPIFITHEAIFLYRASNSFYVGEPHLCKQFALDKPLETGSAYATPKKIRQPKMKSDSGLDPDINPSMNRNLSPLSRDVVHHVQHYMDQVSKYYCNVQNSLFEKEWTTSLEAKDCLLMDTIQQGSPVAMLEWTHDKNDSTSNIF